MVRQWYYHGWARSWPRRGHGATMAGPEHGHGEASACFAPLRLLCSARAPGLLPRSIRSLRSRRSLHSSRLLCSLGRSAPSSDPHARSALLARGLLSDRLLRSARSLRFACLRPLCFRVAAWLARSARLSTARSLFFSRSAAVRSLAPILSLTPLCSLARKACSNVDDRIDVACSTSRPYPRKVVLATLIPLLYNLLHCLQNW